MTNSFDSFDNVVVETTPLETVEQFNAVRDRLQMSENADILQTHITVTRLFKDGRVTHDEVAVGYSENTNSYNTRLETTLAPDKSHLLYRALSDHFSIATNVEEHQVNVWLGDVEDGNLYILNKTE